MKTILNRILITTAISPALILLSVSPALAVAKTSTSTSSAACSHIITLRDTGRDGITSHITNMATNYSNRLKKITSGETAADVKLATVRTNAKKQFQDKIAQLESTAGLTNAQKQAIETYKTGMETAEMARESAVDMARSNYRTALTALLEEQQKVLTNTAAAYQAAFEKAFAAATTDCNNANLPTVKKAVQTAHQDLKTAVSNVKISDKIKQLETTRNNAIKTANDAFTKQATAYTKTLKTALGE